MLDFKRRLGSQRFAYAYTWHAELTSADSIEEILKLSGLRVKTFLADTINIMVNIGHDEDAPLIFIVMRGRAKPLPYFILWWGVAKGSLAFQISKRH